MNKPIDTGPRMCVNCNCDGDTCSTQTTSLNTVKLHTNILTNKPVNSMSSQIWVMYTLLLILVQPAKLVLIL